jgi:Zn-dependent protease with chaperone function
MADFFYKLGRMVGPKMRQANWVYQSMAGSNADMQAAEHAVGRDLAADFIRHLRMDPDPDIAQGLNDIGGRLAECFTQNHRFTFRAIQGGEPNAFALPGGYVFITRPLLELCGYSADEIAFVLGHEMGHIVCRHAIERLMAGSMIQTGLSRVPAAGVLVQVVTSLLQQGYSQDQELEADHMGVRLAHFAGFDASASVRALTRLGVLPPELWLGSSYFSSHPPVNVRIDRLQRWLAGKRE